MLLNINSKLSPRTKIPKNNSMYSERQNKMYIIKIIMLINYRYFYLKIISQKGSKNERNYIKFFNLKKVLKLKR